ncbi:MAG: sodium:solute symporter family transporter [Butyricicoccaceae bacterium]
MGGPAEFISSVEAFNPNFLSMFVDGATNTPYTRARASVSTSLHGVSATSVSRTSVRFMGISLRRRSKIPPHRNGMGRYLADRRGHDRCFRPHGSRRRPARRQRASRRSSTSPWSPKFFLLFIAGIFLSAIPAAIMSTADSQLLVTASALTKDFINKIRPQATEKELMWVSWRLR